MKIKEEITRIKQDIINIKNDFDTTICEINNAIKQVADYIRINPEQSCIIAIKKDISNLKKKYNKIFDYLKKLIGK